MLLLCCRKDKTAPPFTGTADFQKAQAFLYKQNDSAFYYFNKVVSNSKDSLQVGISYNNMAIIQSDAGDYFGAQETLLTSLQFLNENKPDDINCLSSDYNELGVNSVSLKNYDAAIEYYAAALRIAKVESYKRIFLNNKALAYQKKGRYWEAIRIYKSIVNDRRDTAEYARVLSNFARTKWLQNPGYNAAPELLTALRLRKEANNLWGQNASYAHLADYYTLKRPDSAYRYAADMYRVASRLNSADDQMEALEKLIRLGPESDAKQYFVHYQRLNDSTQTVRNAAKNQFALIRYDAQKNKADNLRLQKDNADKRYQLIKQKVIIYSTLVLSLAAFAFGIFLYRKRRQRLVLESEKAIQENQLRTSKKVHDVVANGLYRMMSEIENQDGLDKELLLDRIENMYEKSRDISYDKPDSTNLPFSEKLTRILRSFATGSTKVALAGNSNALWKEIDADVMYEIEHVLQELMVNMKKHSGASNVAVRFERKGGRINIYYTDNGVGFTGEPQYKNGLTNTGNRISSIKGSITFGVNVKKGVKILVSFPVAKTE
jgi:tetratricopeptide (TPR) repeat protein